MASYTIALLILGGLVMAAGGIMQLIAAFRQSVWWGLGCMFLPMASLVFLIMHWAEAKKGFITGIVGTLILAGGVMSAEPLRTGYAQAMTGKMPTSFAMAFPGKAEPAAAPRDVNAEIKEKRDHIEQLEAQFGQAGVALVAQYQALNTARTALKANDTEAVARFNAAAAAYQTQNAAQKQRQQDLAATHDALDQLLAERSKAAAAPQAGSATGASAKKVVMYTTSTCPACRAAKEYFARKGVSYEEHDVNSSPAAREEFQRLGGSGVPLILVGSEKMTGFSAQRLDQLL